MTCSGKPQNQLRTAKEKQMAAQQSVGDSIYTREREKEGESWNMSWSLTLSNSKIRLFHASGKGSLTAKLLMQWYKARNSSPTYVANTAN